MAVYCDICGKKVGGFGGTYKADTLTYERAKKVGLELPKNICMDCAREKLNVLEKSPKEEREKLLQKLECQKAEFEKIFISPGDMPAEYEDCGIVSGYCILGTGPITGIASSVTDLFGEQSDVYLKKIKEAERHAFYRLKADAYKMGATAVYNVRINLAEATHGHGMILLSAFGSAAKPLKQQNKK